MDYQKLVGKGGWTIKAKQWDSIDTKTLICATAHRHFVLDKNKAYYFSPSYDPFAQKLCDLVGAKVADLEDQGLHLMIDVSPHTEFNISEKSFRAVAPEFIHKVADDMLVDKEVNDLLEDTRHTITKAHKRYVVLNYANILALGSTLVTAAIYLHSHHPQESFWAPAIICGMGLGSRILDVFRRSEKRREASSRRDFEIAVEMGISRSWAAAAVEHGFRNGFLVLAEGSIRHIFEIGGEPSTDVRTIAHQAQQMAKTRPGIVYKIEAHPNDPTLGSSGATLTVISTKGSSPPRRKKPKEKSAPNPAWSWLPGLAPQPAG